MSANVMVTFIIVGAACALVGAFFGAVISAPQPSDIKPIDTSWNLYEENQRLGFEVRDLRRDNDRLRAENYRYCTMNHAWRHCCPDCYSEHTHVVYAPKEQEVIELLRMTTVPLDELKKKFGVK